jgi:uncharacterized protein YcbX
MNAHVSGLALTAIKGTRLRTVKEIQLGPDGARGDRAFYVVDARGRLQNGKNLGQLQAVIAGYDSSLERLRLRFPDGTAAEGSLTYGEPVATRFLSRTLTARPLVGPWSEALSGFVGREVRVVAPEASAVDRGSEGAASIISRASLMRLADEAGDGPVDGRRFRMLVEVDGVGPHEEDTWMNRRVRVGAALVAVRGHIGRCLVTSRDPDSGEITLPTLDLLGNYRREIDSTEPLPFGIHAEVLEPGPVRVGDLVAVL